jgi:glycerol kinase
MRGMSYLLALDQGTSSSRSIVFDLQGRIVAMAQQELPQIYPQPGWVEHDPMEIWRTQLATAQEVLAKAGVDAKAIRAIGITNQRETTMLWHRKTGRPIHHAIVWQDRRGEPMCARLREAGHDKTIQSRTGLLVDSYFSATKIAWLLENVPGARALADKGELAFGTVDSWLLWQLTGGALHATDVTNASRTMLFNVHENRWDAQLMTLFGVPDSLMPKVLPSSAHYGETAASLFGAPIAIGGVAGDQQAALFGQACFKAGMAKNTYGTGCFMLMHTGEQFQQSANGLVTTSAAQLTAKPEFAIEGSVFVGGAVVQWLRDGLHAIKASTEVQALAETVPDAGGVMMVPAFTGLGAPYWKPDARGMITGLTRGTTVAHIARAALESIAYQSAALLRAMGSEVKELRVDGGACVNDLLMQFQADLLGIPVIRPAVTETTALGAAYLAGLASGVWRSTSELSQLWAVERRFLPTLDAARSSELMARWEHAVRQAALA